MLQPENMGILGMRDAVYQICQSDINMRCASQHKILYNAIKYFIVLVCILEVNKTI